MLAVELAKKNYQTFVFYRQSDNELLTDNDKKYIQMIPLTMADLFEPVNHNNELVKQVHSLGIDIVIFMGAIVVNIQGITKHLNCKTIFSFHGTPFWEVTDTKQYLMRKRNKNFFKKFKYTHSRINATVQQKYQEVYYKYWEIYHACDCYTLLCQQYQEDLEKALSIKEPHKFLAIPNPVPPTPIEYNLNKKKQLLYLGRMSYADKRIDRLIDIWRNIYQKFPDWEFLLVGDGAERANLEKQASNYGLERITFCGKTNKPHEYYDNASILCMSSQFEGIPLVLLEAQQAGIIPIAFNCSAGVASVLSPNWENGVLIDDFSMQEYENALCKLMSDENLRHQMQQNVLNKAKEYDIAKVGEEWYNLFTKLLTQ